MLSKGQQNKNSRRPQRPYPKADITIEDQQREQKKLLSAGKSFQGYNRLNLDIIAISFEHKCFAEAKNRDEYISKIRSKLVEWKYIPDEDSDDGPLKLKLPPHPPAQQHAQQQQQRNFSPPQSQPMNNRHSTQSQNQNQSPQTRRNHQRHHSGPLLTTHIKTNGSPVPNVGGDTNPTSPTSMYPRPGAFGPVPPEGPNAAPQYPSQFTHLSQHQSRPKRPQERSHDQHQDQSPPSTLNNAQRPSTSYLSHHTSPHHIHQQPPIQNTSPKSQPMTHSTTTMSNSSTGSSSDGAFVNIFDPKFLANINLNEPEIRNLWINSVWDYFCSGGQWTGYNLSSNPASQNGSPMPAHNPGLGVNGTGNESVRPHEQGADVDMVGQLGGYLEMRGNNSSRRTEEGRTTRSMSASGPSNGGSGGQGDGQWMSSMDMMDVGMTHMEGVLAGEMDPGVMSPVSFEKWILQ